MSFLITALAIGYVILAGFGFLRLVLKTNRVGSVFALLPLAFVAGFGLLGFWGNLLMVLRWPLSFWALALPLLPLAIFGLAKIPTKIDFRSWRRPNLSEILLILIILFAAGAVFLMSVDFPLHFWDARAIWGMKAKLLYYDQTVFTPNFLDVQRVQAHSRYPLLYPLAQAFIYFSLGQVDDWSVMLWIGLIFPFLLSFFYALAKVAAADRFKALLGTAVLALLPLFYFIDGPAHSGYADTPLALFFLVSFGVLFLWKKNEDQRLFYLGCILTGFLPLLKNEGLMLAALNLIWVSWPDRLSWKECARGLKQAAILLAIVGLIMLPWLVLRGQLPNVNEEQYPERLSLTIMQNNVGRVPAIFGYYLRVFFGNQGALFGHAFLWVGLWYLYVLAMSRALILRAWPEIKIMVMIAAFSLIMAFIYLIGPTKNIADMFDLMSVTLFRVALAITPLLVFSIVMQSEKLGRGKSQGRKSV